MEILQLVQVKCKQIKSRYLYAVFVIKGVAIVYNEQSLMHSAGAGQGHPQLANGIIQGSQQGHPQLANNTGIMQNLKWTNGNVKNGYLLSIM